MVVNTSRMRLWGAGLAVSAGLCLVSSAVAGPRTEITGGLPIFSDVSLKVAPLQTSPVTPGTLGPKAGDGSASIGIGTLEVKSLGSVKGGQKVDVTVALTKEYANSNGFQVVLKFDSTKVSNTTVTGRKEGAAFANAIDLPAQAKGDSVIYGASFLGGTTTAKGSLATLTFTTAASYTGDTEIRLQSVQVRISGGTPANLKPGASVVLSSSPLGLAGIPSDFDASGPVDFDDFFLFAAAFGKKQGESGFEAKFDLSTNGVIDFDDFFVFAGDFGKKK